MLHTKLLTVVTFGEGVLKRFSSCAFAFFKIKTMTSATCVQKKEKKRKRKSKSSHPIKLLFKKLKIKNLKSSL